MRAAVRARLIGSELGQMGAERGMDRGRGLERRSALGLLGLAQPFEQFPQDRSWIARRSARRERVDAVVDRVDPMGDRFQAGFRGAGAAEAARDRIGDLFDHFPVDGRIDARLEFRFERAHQRLDRTEIDRRGTRFDSRAEFIEKGLELACARFAQEPFDRANVDSCGRKRLQGQPDAVDAAREVLEPRRASDFLIEPRCDLFQATLDRGERRGRRGPFDLPARLLKQRRHLGGFEVGNGTCAKPLDAIGQVPDLPLQPFERRRAQRGRGEEIARLLGLPPDALEALGIDRRRRKAVDLAADRANLAFEPGGRRLRVMRLHRGAEFRGHRLERSEHRFAVPALAQHLHPLDQIADRALERDDGVARRKVGKALSHGVDLGAQGGKVDGGRRAAPLARRPLPWG